MKHLAMVLVGWVALAAQAEPAAAPAASSSAPAAASEQLSVRLHVGGQLGLPHILGLTAMGSVLLDGKPRLDVDVLWEPSLQLQSYSLGLAWRPLGVLAVGPRLRLLQFEAPWSRLAAISTQTFFGLGLEAGARIPLGASKRSVFTVGLQATWVPAQVGTLQWLVGLNVGFIYGVKDFAIPSGG